MLSFFGAILQKIAVGITATFVAIATLFSPAPTPIPTSQQTPVNIVNLAPETKTPALKPTIQNAPAQKMAEQKSAQPINPPQTLPPPPPPTEIPSQPAVRLTNAEIIQKVKPAVVYIETTNEAGSGFIIDSYGFILTNAHVVQGSTITTVKLSDGRTFQGLVVGRNEDVDLAVLKIVAANLPVADLGNSDALKQGDLVYALGYPFGLAGDVSFKDGTLSRRLTTEGETYLETSVEIHPGNSGGPLVDAYGKVVGINTETFGLSVEGVAVGETIKLAIPINFVKTHISQLKAGENIIKPVAPLNQQISPPVTETPSPSFPPITDYSQVQGVYFYDYAGNPPAYLGAKIKVKAIIGNHFLAAGDKGGDSNYIGTADPNSRTSTEIMLKIADNANYQKAVAKVRPYDLDAAYGYGAASEYFTIGGVKTLIPVIYVVRLDDIGGCDVYGCLQTSSTQVFP